jgi:hypothetical protein
LTEQLIEQSKPTEPHRTHDVRVTVEYLPATKPFHHEYSPDTTIGTVQADAMSFFGVRDYQDRDTHRFFLEFHHQRLTNLSETLHQLLGDKREAEFHLVEQITPGGPSK